MRGPIVANAFVCGSLLLAGVAACQPSAETELPASADRAVAGGGGVGGHAAGHGGGLPGEGGQGAGSMGGQGAGPNEGGAGGEAPPPGTEGYTVPSTTTTLYQAGFVTPLEAAEDEVDVYVPLTGVSMPMPGAVLMQGGRVDKSYYRTFSQLVAAHGFVVAVANHDSFSGTNMTEQSVLNAVWDALGAASADPSSPLCARVDSAKLAVMGHSLGGLASLAILSNQCTPPLCLWSYSAPPELVAGVVYGTNTKTPGLGTFLDYDLRNLPTLFVQGDLDGKALLEDGLVTFHDHVTGSPRGFVTVAGANHYGITDVGAPTGADPDPSPSTLDQPTANETVARWTAMFLRAHLLGDAAAYDYVYAAVGDTADAQATIELVE